MVKNVMQVDVSSRKGFIPYLGYHLEINVRESGNTGSSKYMAWVLGHHQLFAYGCSPLEAIGALVEQNRDLFAVWKIHFR